MGCPYQAKFTGNLASMNSSQSKNKYKVMPIMKDHQIRSLTNHPACGHANKIISDPAVAAGSIPSFCSHSIALINNHCTLCVDSPKIVPTSCQLHFMEKDENKCIICIKNQPSAAKEEKHNKEVCIVYMPSSKILVAEAPLCQNLKSKLMPQRWLDAVCFFLALVAIMFFIFNEVSSALAFDGPNNQ